MTNKEIEFIQKLNSNSTINIYKKISADSSLSYILKAMEYAKKDQEIINKILSPHMEKIFQENKKLVENLENNLVFTEIWNTSLNNFKAENKNYFKENLNKFTSDIKELSNKISYEKLKQEFPVNEIMEKVNEVSEEPITKEALKNAIGFIYASSCSENENISFSARKILADLGKISKSDEGCGITFVIALILFLKELFS